MILVAGITGRVGGAAARAILKSGTPVRALVRSTSKAVAESLRAADIVQGDLGDRDSLGKAMAGVDTALLVAPNSSGQLELERNFIDVAVASGVRHVVKISSMEAAPDAHAPFPMIHYAAEQHLKASGLKWTILQPNFFMENMFMFAKSIREQRKFALPFGNARSASVCCNDVGEAAGVILLDGSGHEGRTYRLTAGSLLSFAEIAEAFSRVCGTRVDYVDMDPEEFRLNMSRFVKSEWHVNAVCALFNEIKGGALEITTTDLQDLLRREPESWEAFATRHRSEFC
jgi:uncharacterized protein YbjT (DUF2867 family)